MSRLRWSILDEGDDGELHVVATVEEVRRAVKEAEDTLLRELEGLLRSVIETYKEGE